MALFPTAFPAVAQQHASIPTYHWSNDYARELSLRHRGQGWFMNTLPFTVGELSSLHDSVAVTASSSAEQYWLKLLREYSMSPMAERPLLHVGGRLSQKLGKTPAANGSRLGVRTQLGIFPDEHVAIVNAIRVDEELGDDPTYLGKRWRDFSGYTEQAYLALNFGKYHFKLGRDFVWWGPGFDATLMLSDYSRPLDQFRAGMKLSRLRIDYLAAKLNTVSLPDSLAAIHQGNFSERFLSGVRAEFVIVRNILTLAATQMVLYGTPGRSFEWYYFNPLLAFHGEQVNEELQGNTFGALDFVWRPRNKFEIYGQFLLDDIQVEKTGPGDLEPNEIGYMLGGRVADPFALTGLSLGLEYTRVANRTYNTLTPWEKFMHRNRPLAHFLGNDFDRWLLHANAHAGNNVQVAAQLDLIRHGEGTVAGEFDTPWENFTVEQGYAEKFPFGIVEKNLNIAVQARWHPVPGFFVELEARHSHFTDYRNQDGVGMDDTAVLLRLWGEKLWWVGLD